MSERSERFRSVVSVIDEANGHDPITVPGPHGPQPKELVHAEAMSEWVERLDPDATELELIAARAHHFRRWTRPRRAYPEGRAGYLRWRRDARRQHASEVREILVSAGFDDNESDRVCALITKSAPTDDRGMRVHEDAVCLVFLHHQAADVAAGMDPGKARTILAKTLQKMSPVGRSEARRLDLDSDLAGLIADICDECDRNGADPSGPS